MARDGKALFGEKTGVNADGSAAGDSTNSGGGWTVMLAGFRGDTATEQASAAATQVRSLSGFADVFVERRGNSTIVGQGRFDSPGDAPAKTALERVRGFALDNGRKPFASARLLPPDFSAITATSGKPEWNLTKAQELFGKAAKYTLQIGTYGGAQPGQATGAELPEARAAAEAAVTQLRGAGEMAFYYHSPRMSTVTVGLFDDDVLDNPLAPELTMLKKKYPNRLHNGQGLSTRVGDGKQKLQESALVAVPER